MYVKNHMLSVDPFYFKTAKPLFLKFVNEVIDIISCYNNYIPGIVAGQNVMR